jgi:outer membrane protein assembly factor BamB
MWECRKCREHHEDWFAVCWNCGTSREGVEDPDFVPLTDGPSVQEHSSSGAATGSVEQLIFVGLNGYALALDRDTGEIVWSNNDLRSGYVTLLLDGDRLIVSCNGYTYCLDPLSGRTLWHNPLPGYGVGPTSLASVRGQSRPTLAQQARAKQAESD